MIPCLFLHRRQNMADVTEFTKNSNPMEIVINDGSERVPIKNLSGEEIGVFYFRPTDIGIIDRYNKIAKEFGGITEPLDRAEIGPDGTVEDLSDEESIAALKEAEERLCEAVDYLFGGNMSEAFFGRMHPFSPVGGRFYAENALDAVGSFIEARFDTETEKIAKRTAKYTKGMSRRRKK